MNDKNNEKKNDLLSECISYKVKINTTDINRYFIDKT